MLKQEKESSATILFKSGNILHLGQYKEWRSVDRAGRDEESKVDLETDIQVLLVKGTVCMAPVVFCLSV